MSKKEILLGAHVSIAGGIYKAITRGEEIGATVIQIFTKSSRSWTAKKLTSNEIQKFKDNWKNSKKIQQVVAHTSYLINLAAKNHSLEKKSIKSLSLELKRCEELGIPYLVLHPGSLVGQTEEEGIKKISQNLDSILKNSKGKTSIVLETTAGQGTSIGHTFEQLKKIRLACKEKNKVGVCIDTCHIFAAGYDISTKKGYHKVMKKFEKILGKKVLKVIHLNDSKGDLGSKIDRHANIGKGKIPKQTFSLIMNDKRFFTIPKILETPVQQEKDFVNEIKLLKKMIID
ncbi:deoxyribonuclease IV [Candidatus Dependentiae bacterium]|nr:deoxyribonuclease IV [Candidatus Dependentiae bacterium]